VLCYADWRKSSVNVENRLLLWVATRFPSVVVVLRYMNTSNRTSTCAPEKQGIMQSDLYQQIFYVFTKENRLENAKKIDKAKECMIWYHCSVDLYNCVRYIYVLVKIPNMQVYAKFVVSYFYSDIM